MMHHIRSVYTHFVSVLFVSDAITFLSYPLPSSDSRCSLPPPSYCYIFRSMSRICGISFSSKDNSLMLC